MSDPFRLIDAADMDKDTLTRLAWLAVQCREQSIMLLNVAGWILPCPALPWPPARATELRRCLHHVERCRGTLQSHVQHFPSMDKAQAEAWVVDLARHHGSGPWPSWWSPSVAKIAEQIVTFSREDMRVGAVWVPLVRLEEIMGVAPAHALATARGGNSVYVGQRPSPDLVALCGDVDAAMALSKHYGGSDIILPTALIRPLPKKLRIAAMLEVGASTLEVVRACGCTARYVASVRRDLSGSVRTRPEPKKPTIIAMLKARRKWSDKQIAEQTGAALAYVGQLRSALKRGMI